MEEPDLETSLALALAPDDSVVTAWLFGSQARGTARPGSDVDVALLFTGEPERWPAKRWELEARLSTLLRRAVEVVPIERAPADLVRRVLRDGHLLLDRDPVRRVAFEVRKRNEYFDMTPIWRLIRRLPHGVAP